MIEEYGLEISCTDNQRIAFPARSSVPSHSTLGFAKQYLPNFRIPSSGQLGPIFTRTIRNVGFATPAVVLPQMDSI